MITLKNAGSGPGSADACLACGCRDAANFADVRIRSPHSNVTSVTQLCASCLRDLRNHINRYLRTLR